MKCNFFFFYSLSLTFNVQYAAGQTDAALVFGKALEEIFWYNPVHALIKVWWRHLFLWLPTNDFFFYFLLFLQMLPIHFVVNNLIRYVCSGIFHVNVLEFFKSTASGHRNVSFSEREQPTVTIRKKGAKKHSCKLQFLKQC